MFGPFCISINVFDNDFEPDENVFDVETHIYVNSMNGHSALDDECSLYQQSVAHIHLNECLFITGEIINRIKTLKKCSQNYVIFIYDAFD